MASGDAVQQIKDRLSIVDVISPYVELHNAGKSLKGKSPFTSEKTPSFYVSPDRGMYYCFSTSQGGDIFTFIEQMEGVDFKGALKILADKAGVELVPEDPKKRTERDTQYSILDEAVQFYVTELAKNTEATEYLLSRGITKETLGKWRIGYAPGPPKNGWRHAREYLKGKNFSEEAIQKAGLVKAAGEGKESYDVFRDRLMFPLFDPSGRVVAFSGRILTKDSDAPKYVNSPETELFNKSEILYGYDRAKQGIRKFDFSLIVEGQFDVVLSHQAGYTNAVAVSGTAMTPHHTGLLQRLSNRVVLALDADRAGIAAVKRSADIMLSRGVDVKVARIPEGKDPADIIKEDPELFKKIVGHATHVIEFLLDILKKDAKDDRTYKLQARDEILPFLLKIESQIDREHFVGVIATALDTTVDAIHLEIARLESLEQNKRTEPIVQKAPETQSSQRRSMVPTLEEKLQERFLLLRSVFTVLEHVEDDSKKEVAKKVHTAYDTALEKYGAGIEVPEVSVADINHYIGSSKKHLGETLEEQLHNCSMKELAADSVEFINDFIGALLQTQIQILTQTADMDTNERMKQIGEWKRIEQSEHHVREDFLEKPK